MALFTVLEPQDGKPDRVAFIPEGFALGAFVFTFLWALWHRMWVVAALLFAAFTALTFGVAYEIIDPGLGSLLQFGLSLIFGFEAWRLKESSLLRGGFRHVGLIQASDFEAAELAYFAERAPAPPAPAPAPVRYRTGPEDTLGIFSNV
jgi:hypothetical protein